MIDTNDVRVGDAVEVLVQRDPNAEGAWRPGKVTALRADPDPESDLVRIDVRCEGVPIRYYDGCHPSCVRRAA